MLTFYLPRSIAIYSWSIYTPVTPADEWLQLAELPAILDSFIHWLCQYYKHSYRVGGGKEPQSGGLILCVN